MALAAGSEASPNYLKPYAYFLRKNGHDDDGTPHSGMLTLYAAYIHNFIDPSDSTVERYLFGTIDALRTIFKDELENARDADLVKDVLAMSKRLPDGVAVGQSWKDPMTLEQLEDITSAYSQSQDIDDRLFVALLTIGYFGLLRLGELTDREGLIDRKSTIRRNSLRLDEEKVSFTLPARKKTDSTGMSTILCDGPESVELLRAPSTSTVDPVAAVREYISVRDQRFPGSKWLWLTSRGEPPMRPWFTEKFEDCFVDEYGGDWGYSMRLGGAGVMAQEGVGRDVVRHLGRWKNGAFQAYVRQHPTVRFSQG
jgi:hypothetical protein